MKNEWEPVRLGDLASIQHGWPFKSEHFHTSLSGGPIVVSVGNFRYSGGFRFYETMTKEYRDSFPSDYALMPGDILLVMTCQTQGGEILGIPARIPNDGRTYLHNQRLGKVVIHRPDRVDANFLYWLFLSKQFNAELCASATGTKIVHTAPHRIEAFQFKLPPIETQRSIANALDTLESKLDLNRQMNQTLEEAAAAIFKSWFIDFDPVRAKATGAKSFPMMSQEVFEALPTDFSVTSDGAYPSTWRVAPIGDCVSVKGGGTPSTAVDEYWADAIYHWVTPKDLSGLSSPVLIDTERKLSDAGLEQIGSGLLPVGTVLLSSRAPIGYIAVSEVPTAVNQGFIAMVCDGELPTSFVWCWTESHVEEITARANGTTFPEVSKTNFRPMPVVVPSAEVVAAFSSIVDPMLAMITANTRESRTLTVTRDYLLPRLLSGEVRV